MPKKKIKNNNDRIEEIIRGAAILTKEEYIREQVTHLDYPKFEKRFIANARTAAKKYCDTKRAFPKKEIDKFMESFELAIKRITDGIDSKLLDIVKKEYGQI